MVKYRSVKVSHTVTASSKVTIAYYVNDIPSKLILVFSFLARPIFTSRSKNSKIGLTPSKICSLECAVSIVFLGDRAIYKKITNLHTVTLAIFRRSPWKSLYPDLRARV